jgi:hypothetical protein
MVERVNELFTAVDWGMSANGKRFVNMGFVIKEIKINDRPNSQPGHYNSEFPVNGQFDAHGILSVSSSFIMKFSRILVFFKRRRDRIDVFNRSTFGQRIWDVSFG